MRILMLLLRVGVAPVRGAVDRLLSETTGLLFGVEEDGKTLVLVDSRTGESILV